MIWVTGLSACTLADAQTDISVELAAHPSSGLIPGQPIVFTLAVTNHGPVAVPTSGSKFSLFSSDFYDQFDVGFPGTADCQGFGAIISDGKTFHYNLVWFPTSLDQGALEVGEIRSCRFTLALSNQAPPVWPFSFGAAEFFDDINPDNNVSTVILRRGDIAPVELPALTMSAFILLTTALAFTAWLALRGRRRLGASLNRP
ncbi:hypothetical protein [Dokdonella sp.]|uniref:hypothetical protein n=1 Tax=Dokdonella sp. TaxID=2291710 RepID=UPI00352989AD